MKQPNRETNQQQFIEKLSHLTTGAARLTLIIRIRNRAAAASALHTWETAYCAAPSRFEARMMRVAGLMACATVAVAQEQIFCSTTGTRGNPVRSTRRVVTTKLDVDRPSDDSRSAGVAWG